jgi:hypothetical protein
MEELTKRMSVEDLKKTPEFQHLTQKQRLFVATYCAGGLLDGNYDPIAATRTAYNCKNYESARCMSYPIMQNIRIVAVLNLHFGRTPIEDFIVLLDRAINNKKLTNAQLGALRLKSDLLRRPSAIPNRANVGVLPEDVRAAEKKKKSKKPRESQPPDIGEYVKQAQSLKVQK